MDLKNKIAELFALILILALAGWLRFHDLGTNPPGVFRDEAEKALNAWALARTGQAFEFVMGANGYPDVQWSTRPLFIKVLGVETSSFYHWSLSLLAHQDHPPTPFQMRVPAAMAGVISVIAVYGISRLLFGPLVALLAALLLAISPWSVMFSRWALQGSFIPFFIMLGVGGVMLAKIRHYAWLLLGAFALAMAFYTYSGARPFVLAFVAVVGVLEWRAWLDRQKRLWLIASLLLFAILIAPALMAMTAPGGTTRFDRISVFGGGRSFVQGLAAMAKNYIVHYSPRFLFLDGDPQLRHGVQSFGVLYHIEFLFALIGLIALFIRRHDGKPTAQLRWICLAWVVLFPVGAMLTNPAEMPHALRSIVFLPLPQILAAYGFVVALQYLRQREEMRIASMGSRRGMRRSVLAAVVTATILAASVWAFAVDLFRYYPRYSVREWEGGFGDALAYARKHTPDGAAVWVSGSIALSPYLILYYDQTSPEQMQKEGWGALHAMLLPPQMNLADLWQQLPKGSTLIALPEDAFGGAAFPNFIAHPPAPKQSDREKLPVMYVVYRKN